MREDEALQYLQRDPILHMGMIEPIRRGTAEVLFADASAVLIHEIKSGAYMLSADTQRIGEALLDTVPQGSLWTVHQPFMVKPVRDRYGLRNTYECLQAVYLSPRKLDARGALRIAPLDMAYAAQISEKYRMATLEELQDIIRDGSLYGGFLGDELAAFGGFHKEGSIGMLEVFPPYRRRGFAVQLESRLVNLLLSQGRVPYAQIFPDNEQSVRLHKKLGFQFSAQTLFWMD